MRYIILIVLTLASALAAIGGTAGILEGKVVDKDSKEPIIGATVQIVGTNQGAATNLDGEFLISNVEAGTYDVRVTNIGYQPALYKKVLVRPDLRTKISVELQASAVELNEIEITAERPMIEKDVTSTTFSVSSQQIDKLPVRNVQELLALFPSVTAEGNVRGGKSSEVVYLVDGLPMQDAVGGGAVGSLPKSSITEFSIQSGGFEAEYGNALSGVVNIVTKRGSDRLSGVFRVEKDDWLAGTWNTQTNHSSEFEMTLSGPIIKDALHFFSATTFNVNDTRWWQDFDDFYSSPISKEIGGIAKLDVIASQNVRITAQTVYSFKEFHDYEWSWRFNLNGLPDRTRNSVRTTATLSHTISEMVHYTLNFSYYNLHTQIGGAKEDIPLVPYEYDFFLQYIVQGSRAYWADQTQNVYTVKGDVDIQPNQHNVLKFGFEFNQYNIVSDIVRFEPQRTYFGKILPDEPQLNYSSAYHYYPRMGSVYIQDKLEVDKDGAVVNLGFRWDFMDPRSERPVVESVPLDSSSGQNQSQVVRLVPATVKQQVSPRMGLSFPLAWNILLTMSYGHYFQFPLFDYLYSGTNPAQLLRGVGVLVANPDLKPERTHAWEIGMKYGINENHMFSVTYFKKEFIDQIDSKTYVAGKARVGGDFGFAEYVNNAFANAEGVEFIFTRRHDDRISGSLSYSLMRTEGVSDYVNQGINLAQWGFPILNQPYPLSWDQLHTLKAVIDAKLPFEFYGNLVWTYNSGRPYTYFPTKDGYTPLDTTQAFIPNNARMASNSTISIKFTRRIQLSGLSALTFYGEVRNVFDSENPRWADSNGRVGGQLGDPSAYYEGRRFSLGIKYEL